MVCRTTSRVKNCHAAIKKQLCTSTGVLFAVHRNIEAMLLRQNNAHAAEDKSDLIDRPHHIAALPFTCILGNVSHYS
jgi:hypothetical protein